MHLFSPYLSCFTVSQKPDWMTQAIIKKMPSLKLTHNSYNL